MQFTAICLGVSMAAATLAAPAPSDMYARDVEALIARGNGETIVNDAKSKEGLPYVWGGGDINGPTNGGFDCSGLTSYAVFQATGVKLPRTAQTQYHAAGKQIPYREAQAGDLLFWAEGGNCNTGVKHVGIAMGAMRPGYMVNAATTGTPVREQTIWTSSGGESICPMAVRFW